MRNLYSIALFTALVASAACGSDSKSAPATANAVIPADGFIGRKVRVEISGDNTTWTSAATVTFGDGITVGSVSLASPTDLFAEITIAPTAAEGLRDVTVTDGGTTTTLTQAFSISNPVTIKLEGTIAQGSIGLFTITNHDFENPFDTTSTGGGFSPVVYTNLAISSPAGTTFQLSNVTAYSAAGTVFLDTTATSGPLTVMSGPAGGDIVTSPAPAITVAARTATVLMPGMAQQSTVTKPFDSALYELDIPAAAATLARVKTTTTSATGKPIVILLPASGAWADEVASGASVAQVATAATKYYAITLDEQGNSGFAYSVTGATAAMTVVNEVEPNNTVGQAQAAPAMYPALLTGASGSATLTDDTDVDFIKVTVPAGKAVHVITLPGDAQCDTVVDVFNATGQTSLGGPSSDSNYHEDFTSSVVPSAGTYLVQITASQQGFFDPTMNHYQAAIFFE